MTTGPLHRLFRRPLGLVHLLVLLLAAGRCTPVQAQDARVTMALQGVPLDEALGRLVDATGLAVSFDPALVRDKVVYCSATSEPIEEILRCFLEKSGLDFYRLSSGTYVVVRRAEVAALRGRLAGIVVDRATGAPVADAHVLLADGSTGTVTNAAGRFVFAPMVPGRYRLAVSHLGYRSHQDTVTVSPGGQTYAEVRVLAQPIVIAPVVIDGIAPREGAGVASGPDAPVGMRAAGETGRWRHLQALAGVRLQEATADVHLQGGDAGEHQVLLDGVPVFLPRGPLAFVGPFSPLALGTLTVHKAGFGAAYGSHLSGVVEATHALGRRNDLEVQVDPYALDARFRGHLIGRGGKDLSVMVAPRVGLWDVFAPGRLQATLDDWTTADPFLFLAPLKEAVPPTRFSLDSLRLNPTPAPALHFADVHAAARLRLDPLHTLNASFYWGTRRLVGDLRDQGEASNVSVTAGPPPRVYDAVFGVTDAYRWRTTMGQLAYQAVVGGSSLVDVQLSGSRYRLDQAYTLLDSLTFDVTDAAAALIASSRVPVDDGNTMTEWALKSTFDVAYAHHYVQVGLEGTVDRSRFDLLAASLRATEDNTASGVLKPRPLVLAPRDRLVDASDVWRLAAFAGDTWHVGAHARIDAGLRLTYLPDRDASYAEPRLALRLDGHSRHLGPWAARTAAGVYRQYVTQVDVSKLNAGALLPASRLWLPVDRSLRPPLALHVSQALAVDPTPAWHLAVEGYGKIEPNTFTAGSLPAVDAAAAGAASESNSLLRDVEGRAWGGSTTLRWATNPVRLEARYEYSYARQRRDDLFDGRWTAAPWNEPHRLTLSADWTPSPRWIVSARWNSVWGRSWGYRRAYYEYFSGTEGLDLPADLNRPGEDVLPALHQLDVSLAFNQRLGTQRLQIRLEVLNALDHHNVLEWLLLPSGDGWTRTPRPLYPIMPSLAVRWGW